MQNLCQLLSSIAAQPSTEQGEEVATGSVAQDSSEKVKPQGSHESDSPKNNEA